jgi:Na+/H+ antiporter NhaD/arsenite permease-like protein
MDPATGLVLAVFVAVYVGMALGRWPGLRIDRTGIAILGAIVLYETGVVDGEAALEAIDWPTLIMLFGLMILSAQFAVCGFYDWCSSRIAATAASPSAILVLVVVVAGVLSAVLANDVVVFAMTPLLATGLVRRGLDPRPFLIGLAGAANAGSAATLIGNPQNILIGQIGGLDFLRFLLVCGPPALFGLLSFLLVVWLTWRRCWHVAPDAKETSSPSNLDRPGLIKGTLGVLILLGLFASPLDHVAGLLLVAGALLISRRLATREILGLVDWHLLVLFGGLFVVTAALAATGLPSRLMADLATRGMEIHSLSVLLPLTLIGSNAIGNVPIVLLVLQVLPDLPETTLHALAVLSTLAGNLLVVGSLANIITVERARQVGVELSFADHARSGVPMTLLSLVGACLWFALIA